MQHDADQRGGGWEARFQGRDWIRILNVDKGAEYINLLLVHPGREASVYEVVCGYALGVADAATSGLGHDEVEKGFQVTTGAPLSDAGVVVDRKAVEQYRAKYQSLATEKAEAEEDGDHQRLEEIEIEMAQIADAITGGTAKGGRLRKAGDKCKNVRDAFRNAVNRAITTIAKYDKPLAEHLKVTSSTATKWSTDQRFPSPGMSGPSSTSSPLRGRVTSVKADSDTNKPSETRANAGAGAAASFAETENGREQRTQKRPKPSRPGQRRPSQRGPNPRQRWWIRAKKKPTESGWFFK